MKPTKEIEQEKTPETEKESLSRRSFFLKAGVSTLGLVAATHSLAQVCKTITGKQPLGPYFPKPGTPEVPIKENPDPGIPLHLANDNDLTFIKGQKGKAKGQVVYIRGKILDKKCQPIPHAMVVIWQASQSGRYNHLGDENNLDFTHPKTGQVIQRNIDPSFQYWGKTKTNSKGEYEFKTILPGFYPANIQEKWYRPPHIHFLISAKGYPQLVTQMYFKSKEFKENAWIQELNKKDILLQSKNITTIQREKLIVEFKKDPKKKIKDGLLGYFDIVLNKK